MKKTGSIIIVVILIAISALFILTQISAGTINSVNDIEQINYQDSFSQSDEDYLVYFWQEGCYYCEVIDEEIIAFANDATIPLFVVDMHQSANQNAWYDWDNHHELYDEKIGDVVNDEHVLFPDIDLDDFAQDTEVNWQIEVNESDELIAVHQTSFPNTTAESADQIEISGTPTVIHIKDGNLVDYTIGPVGAVELLSSNQ